MDKDPVGFVVSGWNFLWGNRSFVTWPLKWSALLGVVVAVLLGVLVFLALPSLSAVGSGTAGLQDVLGSVLPLLVAGGIVVGLAAIAFVGLMLVWQLRVAIGAGAFLNAGKDAFGEARVAWRGRIVKYVLLVVAMLLISLAVSLVLSPLHLLGAVNPFFSMVATGIDFIVSIVLGVLLVFAPYSLAIGGKGVVASVKESVGLVVSNPLTAVLALLFAYVSGLALLAIACIPAVLVFLLAVYLIGPVPLAALLLVVVSAVLAAAAFFAVGVFFQGCMAAAYLALSGGGVVAAGASAAAAKPVARREPAAGKPPTSKARTSGARRR